MDKDTLIEYLQALIARVEKRGVEDVSLLSVWGMTETTRPLDAVRNYRPTKDQFITLHIRYEE
jgi:hypothetical protein